MPRSNQALSWTLALGLTLAIVAGVTSSGAADCPWVGSSQPVDVRAGDVLSRMTLDEKLSLVHGSLTAPTGIVGPVYAGLIPAIDRLCIPQLGLLDGPVGVGDGLTGGTQLPAPIALAASWDPALADAFGDLIGSEVAGKGANIGLGPAVDIVRDPRAGRGFEAFGEDPYLASRFGVSEIRAIQANGIIAQVKHYAVYNQETLRDTVLDDAKVDERTMHEIYLPPFEAAVTEANVGSVMCSYNFVNGVHACNHTYLLSQVLKGEWGFDGFVTSDWYGTQASADAANAGLDMQMPDHCYFGPAMKEAIQEGRVPRARLDDMVRRILRSMFTAGLFEHPVTGTPDATVTTEEHAAVARSVAENGMVLLKNDGDVLPLGPGVSSIAVLGPGGDAGALTGGGGSSAVIPPYVVTPLEGIRQRAGSGVDVPYAEGTNLLQAATVARSSDVAIVFARLMQGEFKDRLTLELFPTDTLLIETVAHVNPNTIVVLNTGSATTMPWLGDVKGVVQAWYPGQEYGHAVASVLFGDVNPSGKLPVTFPTDLRQVPANTPLSWPGVAGTQYSEGLGVGYRWYDRQGLEPLFPFGFGLSYTRFSLANLSVSPTTTTDGSVMVEADVTNTGDVAGAEVVQLYLSYPPAANEPPHVLRGFAKVALDPGETRRVGFSLDGRALSTWSTTAHRWAAIAGTYSVLVGTSSRDLLLQGSFTLTGPLVTGDPTPPPPPFTPTPLVRRIDDMRMCPKDAISPFVNGVLSVTGLPPLEVLGRPIP
jgi:beta-glucosidase